MTLLSRKFDRELTPDRERKLPMMRRLLFKTVVLPPMTWLAMCLLVTSGGLAQEPVQEPTAPPWPQGLISAIVLNDLPAVKEFLEQGAEVNARDNDADALAKDEDGMKAIDHAKKNDKMKDTMAYWKLHDKSFV